VDIIKFLLDEGNSVNLTDTDDNTQLHVSAPNAIWKRRKFMVDKGAAVNNTKVNGETPLIVAADNGNIEVSLIPIKMSADIKCLLNFFLLTGFGIVDFMYTSHTYVNLNKKN